MNFSVPFYLHELGQRELDGIADVFRTPILTTGETVARFEKEFASYLGRKFALGLTSCTGGLHMSLVALGIGHGDEVITTPMTFIATSSAILCAGARPIFVDVEPDTGNIDATKIEKAISPRTKAIMPVHLYGLMCDMPALRRIADRNGLRLIEDSAHCIEGSRNDLRPGALSNTACFSFFATKNISCGEGGAVVTDDPELYRRLKSLRLHGIDKNSSDRFREGYQHWDMKDLGWKYNMDNIQAAMLLPQLERIERISARRTYLANLYYSKLSKIPGVRFPGACPEARHAHHLFTIWVDAKIRDQVVEGLQRDGIGVAVNYRAIHLLSHFSKTLQYSRGDFLNAERIGDETISLPFFPKMSGEQVDQVTSSLEKVLNALI